MATPVLGFLWVLGLPLLTTCWDPSLGTTNSTSPPTDPSSDGGLSQAAITAIIVVFSLLGALLLTVGLALLVRKLREKRQTEGTYRPSSEEQVGARAPPPPNLKLPPEERLI